MRIVFFGKGKRGSATLNAILSEHFEVVIVICGDSKDQTLDIAKTYNIPYLVVTNPNKKKVIEHIKSLNPDIFVLSGYAQILNSELLKIPPKKTINLHGGKIPDYRGGSPLNWQIINDEKEIWLTILYATEELDRGDILFEESFPLESTMTIQDVINETLIRFPKMLIFILKKIEAGTIIPKKVKTEGVYYAKRKPEDGLLDFHVLSDIQVFNLIRSLSGEDYPGAFSYWNQEKFIFWKSQLIDEEIRGPPGNLIFRRNGSGIIVACKNRGILITHCFDGKNVYSAENIKVPNGGKFTIRY